MQKVKAVNPPALMPQRLALRGDKIIAYLQKSVIIDRDGFTITAKQAQGKLSGLGAQRRRDPELFQVNAGVLDEILLLQHIQQAKRERKAKQNGGIY